jgi:hypothetical protein
MAVPFLFLFTVEWELRAGDRRILRRATRYAFFNEAVLHIAAPSTCNSHLFRRHGPSTIMIRSGRFNANSATLTQ